MVLGTALAGTADYLVTGDQDLLIIRNFGETSIATATTFLSAMAAGRYGR